MSDEPRADQREDVLAPRADRRRRDPATWFWAVGFPLLTGLLAMSVPALLITGRNLILNSTDGAIEHQVTDPAAPGWEAFTEPTPTALVLHHDSAGGLAGVTLLSLTGAAAGALVLIPVDTVPRAGADARSLADLAVDGELALREGVAALVGTEPIEVVSLDDAGWQELVAPVAPLTVENPDDVFVRGADGEPRLRFRKGELALSSSDVPDFLATRNAGERDLNRMVRHDAFWRAWLQAVGSSPAPEAVPGEPGSGISRFVRALAAARLEVSTLPVQVVPAERGRERYVVLDDQSRDLLTRLVPFPVSSDGRRLRIRLLDGHGTLQHGLAAGAALVGAGGQIDQIGNAESFGVARTKLEFADEDRRREVDALVTALGTGEVVKIANIDGATDVIVTLGQDYVDAAGAGGR